MAAVYAMTNAPGERGNPRGGYEGHESAARGSGKGATTKGHAMLKEGDKAPAVTGTSYDGRTFDMGKPAARTVLYFYGQANTSG